LASWSPGRQTPGRKKAMLEKIGVKVGLKKGEYFFNEPLSKHTTWKVGGPADVIYVPKNLISCRALLQQLQEEKIPYFILGNGSNVLVGDKGFRGAVIKLRAINTIDFNENIVTVGSGVALPVLAMEASKRSLSGLEFLAGIPGTVGAGVKVNAGADGANISDVFVSALVWQEGVEKEISVDEMEFSYRTSALKNTPTVILRAIFKLNNGNQENIKHQMQHSLLYRKNKQPIEYPNAGSVFKNPTDNFAGKLIADAGLQGKSIGGATVSTKHANFIVNTGKATAKDIKSLITLVQQEVLTSSGILLEPEVEFIGEFYRGWNNEFTTS